MDPGQRAGEQLQLNAADLEVARERHQLGGVTRGAFQLVHGRNHRLLGRGVLDLAGQHERLIELGPDLDPAGNLLREQPCRHPAACSASSWICRSCCAVEQRA
ncbi:hypothetical protein P3102_15750 [Amycolatopsis sp. QT-25]|uniref:hypothetical protein n=1 Tax=Amycolatopsis sp. QT-25 TaxID=3034022 RepID=UPI0023EBB1A4|nr:hypothetical protein [Amycolatopsis sp. QT-25]WET82551.1 hypothetical protein P3102_15750 [Amycolatopsis sp. QT-25]